MYEVLFMMFSDGQAATDLSLQWNHLPVA